MKKVILLGLVCVSLISCSLLRPYQVPVQQGNILDAAQIHKIKPHMTKQQVIKILGKPSISDPFHPNTFYYVYTNEQKHLPRAQKELILSFKDDKLVAIKGNYAAPTKLHYTTYYSNK
ncbi:MAG: hypothetical protein COB50_03715 [Thiotrichales bacterium]|nr:MAG: hypothetical protein COB50_03715 [Thiotrichales bacterium]